MYQTSESMRRSILFSEDIPHLYIDENLRKPEFSAE